jgi:hypothetical protein
MIWQFISKPGRHETEISIMDSSGSKLPYDRWALDAPEALLPGLDLIQRLIASENAVEVDDVILIKPKSVASLSARESASLSFPPLTTAMLRLQADGLVTQANYKISSEWIRSNGQPLIAQRIGAWLKVGEDLRRLPEALYLVAESVDALNAAVVGGALDDRMRALAELKHVLPDGPDSHLIEMKGLVGAMIIAVADAFSVDMAVGADGEQVVPKLHGSISEGDALLLNAARQSAFEDRFFSAGSVQPIYSVGEQTYVVLRPLLRKALAEVRKLKSASLATRRAFIASPRAYLRDTFGDEIDDVILENIFRETSNYSQRVLGLGLWVPRVVPWIKLPSLDWLGTGDGAAPTPRVTPPVSGLVIDNTPLPLSVDEATKLKREIEQAIAKGETHVVVQGPHGPVHVPANDETLRIIHLIEVQSFVPDTGIGGPPTPPPVAGKESTLIYTNEDDVALEAEFKNNRPAPASGLPQGLKTTLKSHQIEGLAWLQQAYMNGSLGVLLADDMGLGKTLQGLAFLAWLRSGMAAGLVPKAPVLIVAPTGLLANWQAEHDKHLQSPGIGKCLPAFGKGLKSLRITGPDGLVQLNTELIAKSDWVLTTYETLRDYDSDFARIKFAAALFDEAQKIKTPGIRITDAAKAMNCVFRVALTGTPVENRLADLWCIIDGVHPGLLGDLKSFSETFERDLDQERLKKLKSSLERSFGGRPQTMLRRLAHDKLPDLPLPNELLIRSKMPSAQMEAYCNAIAAGRAVQGKGGMLETLQKLRAISLHPSPDLEMGDAEFIESSARIKSTFHALDNIALRSEKVLIFLEDLDLQSRLVGLIQRRYNLSSPPAIINGMVDGAKRQSRVDQFQNSSDGFGVMILSPRAGGVGLTLTRANHVIHLSRWWNPAIEDQCTGRVLRIGQTKQVYIHVPLAIIDDKIQCFDENLHKLLTRKRQLMRDTLTPAEAFFDNDIDEIFRGTVS